MPLVDWVKRNKLVVFLILVVAYFLLKNFAGGPIGFSKLTAPGDEFSPLEKRGISLPPAGISYPDSYPPPVAPAPEVKDRLVVQNSHLSLLVKNVSQTLEQIRERAASLGGYMVESNLARPEEATTGQITVRIPQTKLDEALTYFRSLSVKVVSENLQGEDVTDQYVDIEARLKPLLANKERFEEIMDQAVKIDDILRVQQEIINLQNQIDALRGQQNYLAKTAEMSKVTIFLSTDELSLPYAPSQPWRPEVIFRHAIRSLLSNIQNLGSLIIWIVVYSIIWLPILLIILFVRSRKKNQTTPR
ncbi:MAG: DUF4349 domain-containing protein [bacterium]|nr:DUF4349 domain-containing protein [bacterium]